MKSRARREELILIGYWRQVDGGSILGDRCWPNPADLVDLSWDVDERDMVADFLSRGFVARAYMGYSPCRLCGCDNGNLEFTDGVFVWPEGLRHYVVDHGVRLPDMFVDHVMRTIENFETADRDEAWWASLS